MRMNRVLALGASMLVLISACSTGGGSSNSPAATTAATSAATSAASSEASPSSAGVKAPIKIGSDNFYESVLMAEMYSQVLEKAGYRWIASSSSAPARRASPPSKAGQVDLVPEYVGSGLGYYDKTKTTGDGTANATALQEILKGKGGGITVLGSHPARTATRSSSARTPRTQLKLAKMSDLAAVQDQHQVGPPGRLRHEPALLGRAQGLRDHVSPEEPDRSRCVRRTDGHRSPGQGDRPR